MTTSTVERVSAEIIVPNFGDGTTAHRCDRCGAQAFYHAAKIVNDKVYELTFCAHHGRKKEAALVGQGFSTSDQGDKINDRPSISANAE